MTNKDIKKISDARRGLALSEAKGFTLVELLVVLMMIGVLILGAINIFDPFSQIRKAQDAKNRNNLIAIKEALDLYFHDTGCYKTNMAGVNALVTGTTQTYIKKMPDNISTYTYTSDGTSCPQWYVLSVKKNYTTTSLNDQNDCETICSGVANAKNYLCASAGTLPSTPTVCAGIVFP